MEASPHLHLAAHRRDVSAVALALPPLQQMRRNGDAKVRQEYP